MSARYPGFRCAVLALVAFGTSCGEDHAQGGGVGRRGARQQATRDGIPALSQPSATEADDLARFLATLPPDPAGSVRVLVEFIGLTPRTADARPIPPTTAAEATNRANRIGKAQTEFLERAQHPPTDRVLRYRTVPFLYVETTRAELENVDAWIRSIPPDSSQRPYRVRVERERILRTQARPAPVQDTPVAKVVERLEFPADPVAGEAPIVAVIDARICDEELVPLLAGRIEARAAYALGYPTDTEVEPPLPSDTDGLGHGSQIALAIASSHASPKILALRCDDGTGVIPVPCVGRAIDAVVDTWSKDLGPRLRVVSMSLGEDSCASLEACSCWEGLVNGDGISHSNLLIETIANLDAIGIPIVLPAGNKVAIAGAVAFPACITSVVTVGATNAARFTVSDQSAWGPDLDFCAPGFGVLVDHDTGGDPVSLGPGTSISVPFIASAIAVLHGSHADRSLDEILTALEATGDDAMPRFADQNPLLVPVPEIRVSRAALYLETTH